MLCDELRFGEPGGDGVSETGGTGTQPVSIPILGVPPRVPRQLPSGHPLLFPEVQSKVQQIAKGVVGDLMPLRG